METQETQNLFLSTTEQDRAVFYRKTYLHVALAVLLFVGVEYVFLQIEPLVNFMMSLTTGYLWLLLLGGFWLVSNFSVSLAHRMSRSAQYLGLFLYVVAEALIFVPLLHIAILYTSPQVLQQAFWATAFLFIGLSAVAMFTQKDFSFLRSIITIGVFVAMGLIVLGTIFGFNLGTWFSVAMIGIAGASILYQTSQLKNEYHTSQYVGAALGLFSSLMLLFWYILRLVMSRD